MECIPKGHCKRTYCRAPVWCTSTCEGVTAWQGGTQLVLSLPKAYFRGLATTCSVAHLAGQSLSESLSIVELDGVCAAQVCCSQRTQIDVPPRNGGGAEV